MSYGPLLLTNKGGSTHGQLQASNGPLFLTHEGNQLIDNFKGVMGLYS